MRKLISTSVLWCTIGVAFGLTGTLPLRQGLRKTLPVKGDGRGPVEVEETSWAALAFQRRRGVVWASFVIWFAGVEARAASPQARILWGLALLDPRHPATGSRIPGARFAGPQPRGCCSAVDPVLS